MKKNLFFAALAVVAMASCSKNEAVDPISASDASQSIAFDSFIDRTTKGAVANISTLEAGGFGVIAYNYSSTALAVTFDNAEVTYSSGAWDYGETKYWVENDEISFFAYSPYDGTEANNANLSLDYTSTAPSSSTDFEDPKITVTTSGTISAQDDVLVATSLDNAYVKANGANPITLNFDHILSKIGFTAQAGEVEGGDLAEVALKSVTVKIANPGSHEGLISKATFNMATGAWEFVTETERDYLEIETAQSISEDTLDETDGSELTEKAINVTDADQFLMIIPQELKSDDIITITATYIITESGTPSSDLTKSINIPTSLISEFEMGKQYTFNLILGDEAIRFGTVLVTDWIDGTYTL